MEDIPEGLINALIKAKKACDWLKQVREDIEEQKRRDGLRKGSIDVEFRVMK